MSITVSCAKEYQFIELLKNSYNHADMYSSKLPEEICKMTGMSGIKYRMFINKLIEQIDNPVYLEIGSWTGSTLLSAIYGNKCTATAIDNWSLFGGPYDIFMKNISTCITNDIKLSILYQDYKAVSYENLEKCDVYLFDGPHEYEDQSHGMKIIDRICKDICIVIVDDWNWEEVRQGTFDGIKSINREILYSIEVKTTENNTHPEIYGESSDWHNGYFIACIKK